jgi:hypothetical protein
MAIATRTPIDHQAPRERHMNLRRSGFPIKVSLVTPSATNSQED